MRPLESEIADRLQAALDALAPSLGPCDIVVTLSARPDLGDYASPVALSLARSLKRPPGQLASDLADHLISLGDPLFDHVSGTATGYLNFRLSVTALEQVVHEAYAQSGSIGDSDLGRGQKIIIEHTNINPNKAAHVGHLRNACLGDTLARILAKTGHRVEVQNYIDDTGVQVADVVVGLRALGLEVPEDEPFDRFCSEVYRRVQQAYAERPELLAQRAAVQRAMETGEGELASFARQVTQRVARANLATMHRAGVSYDLLTWESHIVALGFWQHAFEQLRRIGAVRYETDGPNAGCWVIPFGLGTVATDEGTVTEDKVLVTSRGIATYTAKDIAYQLWKFGLLGRDFAYRPWGIQPDGRPLWTTTLSEPTTDAPQFAHGDRVINVIDVSQSYPQQVVYHALRQLGYEDAADRSEHLAYGRVVLSADTARGLGLDVPPGATAVAMSGRGGVQVFADDLLDWVTQRAREQGAEPENAAAAAVGAARYYMLKFSAGHEITFDVEESLRTTGETGVYLQYALVRANGIRRKLDADLQPAPAPRPLADLDRALVLRMAAYPSVLATAATTRSAQAVARYAFELASAFSAFYDNTPPVVGERDPVVKRWRAGLVGAFGLVMADVLSVLGIPAIERL